MTSHEALSSMVSSLLSNSTVELSSADDSKTEISVPSLTGIDHHLCRRLRDEGIQKIYQQESVEVQTSIYLFRTPIGEKINQIFVDEGFNMETVLKDGDISFNSCPSDLYEKINQVFVDEGYDMETAMKEDDNYPPFDYHNPFDSYPSVLYESSDWNDRIYNYVEKRKVSSFRPVNTFTLKIEIDNNQIDRSLSLLKDVLSNLVDQQS